MGSNSSKVDIGSFSSQIGKRRKLRIPDRTKHVISARDGAELHMYRIDGSSSSSHAKNSSSFNENKVVILAGGLAMSGLSFLIDTVEENLVEHLVSHGWDIWLLDWRTSPELEVSHTGYSLEDAARFDWPAAVDYACAASSVTSVSVFAHCMGAASMMISLYKGHTLPSRISSVVCSQVCLFVRQNKAARAKSMWAPDKWLRREESVHFKREEESGCADCLTSVLSRIVPRSYKCKNRACHRQSAVFGDLLRHENLSTETHDAMPALLVPEITLGIVKDVAEITRATKAGMLITEPNPAHMANLAVPITIISGEKNECIVSSTASDSFKLLKYYNADRFYKLHIVPGYGHLDSLIGNNAVKDVYPLIEEGLARRDNF